MICGSRLETGETLGYEPFPRMNQATDETSRHTEVNSAAEASPDSRAVLAFRVMLPVLLLAAGAGSYLWFSKEPPKTTQPRPKRKPTEVQVAELVRQDFQMHVATHGIVQAHGEVNMTAQVAGRVLTIHDEFEVGAFFQKDDVLVELDPIDFEEALINAEAQLAQAEFNLEQETVRATQARLNWEDLGYAERPNDLVLRIPHVKLAESQLERANAQLLSAKRNLERTKVKAPFDGRVLSRSAGVGQMTGAGSPMGVIVATDFSEVRLPISTRFLTDVSLPEDTNDAPITITLKDGLNPRTEVEWPAQIMRTEGALDASTLELFAVARVHDPFGLQSERVPLRIGQPVTSTIPGRMLNDVFVIPREAISDLSRIRLVDPETLKLNTAYISQLWADEKSLVFRDTTIEDGMLLVLNRLVYAPDGGQVKLIEDEVLEETVGSESK